MSTISVAHLGKTFLPPAGIGQLLRGRLSGSPVEALHDLSLEVAPGEIVCVMGPNGAGKSTLLRILAGLLLPSSGEAQVAGLNVTAHVTEYRRRVAFIVGDERSFQWALTGRQNLAYFGALYGYSRAEAATRSTALLDRVGLTEAGDRQFRTYSRGMRQRLSLARGLLGSPQVLLLDEPTLGLDPHGARDLRLFLRNDVIRAAGRTAVVGTNDPGEAKLLADRILLLERGRLVGATAPAQLETALGL